MVETICSNCGNKKSFNEDKLGKKFKCPNCGNIIPIEENTNEKIEPNTEFNQSTLPSPTFSDIIVKNDIESNEKSKLSQIHTEQNSSIRKISPASTFKSFQWKPIIAGAVILIIAGCIFLYFYPKTTSSEPAMAVAPIPENTKPSDTVVANPPVIMEWQSTNGPFGGSINCLTIIGNSILAGTNAGVFLSTNNGSSWQQVNNGLTNTYISALATCGNIIIAGSTDGSVFFSSDQCNSWQKKDLPLVDGRNVQVRDLAVIGNNIFVATYGGGVYLSTDNCSSWREVNNGLTNKQINKLTIRGTELLAGTSSGIQDVPDAIFSTTDYGDNWNNIYTSQTGTFINLLAAKSNSIYFGINIGGFFSITPNGINNINGPERVHTVAVKGSNIFVGTELSGILLSTDNGNSWRRVNNGITYFCIDVIKIKDNNIFAGTRAGVFLSTDNGNNWQQINNGLTAGNANIRFENQIAISGPNIFAARSFNGVQLFQNGINQWINVNNGFGNCTDISGIVASGSIILAAAAYDGVYISKNNGNSWEKSNRGFVSNDCIYNLAVIGTNIFAYSSDKLFRSTDNGYSWNTLNWNKENNGLGVFCLASNGNDIFVGSNRGIYLSSNNGNDWRQINNGLESYVPVSMTTLGNSVFVCCNSLSSNAGSKTSSLFLSKDKGNSWIELIKGLPKTVFTSFAVNGTDIFVGTNDGIFLSRDQGDNWVEVSGKLPDKKTYGLAIDNTYLYVITATNGIWKFPLSGIK